MLDRRTLVASLVFFFAALTNPRDFPVQNVPLLYPAFLIFWAIMGTRTLLRGLGRVKFLLTLLVGYQTYFTVLRVVLGASLSLVDYAYIIEPALILVAAGAATVRPGGTKTATWMFVAVISIAAFCGVGIYALGEPFTTVRATIQQSVGGTVGSDAFLRDEDLQEDLADLEGINAGLSSDAVAFGYQLSAAVAIVMAAMLAKAASRGPSFVMLTGALVVLLAAVLTNSQRATIPAVFLGLAAFLWTGSGRRVFTGRTLGFLTVCGMAALLVTGIARLRDDKDSLLTRHFQLDERGAVRLYMTIPAAATIFSQPFGAGNMSDHYVRAAFEKGWLRRNRDGNVEAHSSHNHFANVIMLGGVAGLIASVMLLGGLWRRLRFIRRARGGVHARMLGGACVASVVHSLFHNAGFFGLVPPTLIAFALLWGEARKPRRSPAPEADAAAAPEPAAA